ncbi:MAG: hypothetical protein ABI467_03290 [Kofleriaceae bacterium]
MRRALALVTSVAMCGCSFAFVHGPKPPPAAQDDCTHSRVVPILDAVATGILALFAGYSAVTDDADYRSNFCDQFDSSCTPPSRAISIATSLAIAAATGAGAYVGFRRVGECRRANPEPVITPAPAPAVSPELAPAPAPNPTPAPTKPGTGSGDLPIPPSGLPVPGAT